MLWTCISIVINLWNSYFYTNYLHSLIDFRTSQRLKESGMKGWIPERNRLLIISIGLLLVSIISQTDSTPNYAARVGLVCLKRAYEINVSKPWYDLDGIRHPCVGSFRVWSCWGFCDSSEIGDYKMPYKISKHPVCTYSSRRNRIVRLNCPGHPDPEVEVFDATGCKCRRCNSEFESCENLSG